MIYSLLVVCALASAQPATLPWYYRTNGTPAPPWYLQSTNNLNNAPNIPFSGRGPVLGPDGPGAGTGRLFGPIRDQNQLTGLADDAPDATDGAVLGGLGDVLVGIVNGLAGLANSGTQTGGAQGQSSLSNFAANQRFNFGPVVSASRNNNNNNNQAAAGGTSNNVRRAFTGANIVPRLVPQAPQYQMTVYYSNGIQLELGNEMRPRQTSIAPSLLYWPADPDRLYTLAMIDVSPDVGGGYVLIAHWIVANIEGNDVRRGDTLVQYVRSMPELGVALGITGWHHYVFVVFEQPSRIAAAQLASYPNLDDNETQGRVDWPLSQFLQDNRINQRPLAGNFYIARAQPEDIAALQDNTSA